MSELRALLEAAVVSKARDWALRLHKQQRYGNAPYSKHLQAVVGILEDFGVTDSDLIAAAWLHDALEDTALTIEELQTEFPAKVAAIVFACTDGPGKNRKERKERPYQLIPNTADAVLIKLADRIANVEESVSQHDDRLLEMYRKEHKTFLARLQGSVTSGPAAKMWARLERNLFANKEE